MKRFLGSTCQAVVSGLVLTLQVGTPRITPAATGEASAAPVVAWPAGPLDVVLALRTPLKPAIAQGFVGQSITFTSRTLGQDPKRPPAENTGTIRIAGARLADGGRTLQLATDPHPVPARYSLAPAAGVTEAPSFGYDLSVPEAVWTEGEEAGAEPSWKGWWPELDLDAARRLAPTSVPHQKGLSLLERPGRLTLSALVTLPAGEAVVRIESSRAVTEASFGDAASEPQDPARFMPKAVDLAVRSRGEPQFLSATVATGPGASPPALRVTLAAKADGPFRPIERGRLLLPWAPLPSAAGGETLPASVPDLGGGDAKRGEALFLGEQARCAQCHAFRGKGGAIGPDLTEAVRKGRDYLYRSIAAPSAEIAPEYLPYTIAAKDGRVLAGLVRAEGADSIRVTDNAAKSTTLRREEIDQIRPSGTSIMPVGLAGVLGEPGLRDLLAYLLGPSGK